ncbi:MAG: hypothetical protein ABSD38_32730 [Syntrophorhabdales bacterium]
MKERHIRKRKDDKTDYRGTNKPHRLGISDPEVRLEKVFDWAHTRRMELVKWVLTASAALFVPVAVAYVKGDIAQATSAWWVLTALFGAVLLALFGLIMLYQARQIHRTYVASIALLGEIRKIAPFVERYREEIERRWN